MSRVEVENQSLEAQHIIRIIKPVICLQIALFSHKMSLELKKQKHAKSQEITRNLDARTFLTSPLIVTSIT